VAALLLRRLFQFRPRPWSVGVAVFTLTPSSPTTFGSHGGSARSQARRLGPDLVASRHEVPVPSMGTVFNSGQSFPISRA